MRCCCATHVKVSRSGRGSCDILEKNRVHNHAFRGSVMLAEEQKQIHNQAPGVCHRYYARAELILDESVPAESASSRLKEGAF